MAAPQEGGAGNQVMKWRYGDVDDSNFAVRGRTVPLLVGLLFLVVVFVALCLYLRWACHRRYTPDPEASSSSSSSAAAAGAAAASMPGLDADAIGGLPVTLYIPRASSPSPAVKGGGVGCGEDDDQAAQCSICISALVAGEKVKALPPCGHCFHPDCVDAWLRAQASCPLCRCLLLAAAKSDVNGGDDAV